MRSVRAYATSHGGSGKKGSSKGGSKGLSSSSSNASKQGKGGSGSGQLSGSKTGGSGKGGASTHGTTNHYGAPSGGDGASKGSSSSDKKAPGRSSQPGIDNRLYGSSGSSSRNSFGGGPINSNLGVAADSSGDTAITSGRIYSRPDLYEAAFSYRDLDQEVQFLLDAYKLHTGGAPLNTVIDLGCGAGAHTAGLARAGIPRVVGLDRDPDMLRHARIKAGAAMGAASSGVAPSSASGSGAPEGAAQGLSSDGSNASNESGAQLAGQQQQQPPPQELAQQHQAQVQQLEFVEGDMTSFSFKELPPADLVVCLLASLSHLLTNAQASDCFGAVSRSLRPGGLFVLELAHPGDLFDGTFITGDGGKEMWEATVGASSGNGHKLLVEWGGDYDDFDPATQVLHRTVTINVMRGQQVVESVQEVVPYRQYTVQEIGLLASMHGLEVVQLYGEMNLEIDLSHEDAYRLVAVLKKR